MSTRSKQSDQDRLLSKESLAAMLDIAPSTVDRWRSYGHGPNAIKLPTGTVRFRLSDVREWIAKNCRVEEGL